MSLTDIGINFKMQGADSVAQSMNQMKSSFEGFSSALGGGQLKGHLDKVEGHFAAMHKGIKSQLHLTELAITGFLAGKAIKGLSNWILGGSGGDIDRLKDYLRIHGVSNEGLKNMGKSMDDLSSKRPLDKMSGWNAAENMSSMLGGLDNAALTDRLTKATSNLSYLLGSMGNMNEAVDLATPFIAGFGAKLDAAGKVELHEKFNSYIDYLLRNTQLRGPDIKNILPQVVGPYLGAGKSPEEMFAHMGALDFLRGQAGEVLKNLFGKEGKSYGAVIAEEHKQSYLAQLQTDPLFRKKENQRAWRQHQERLPSNIQSEADLPDRMKGDLNHAIKKVQEHYEAIGNRLLARGDFKQYAEGTLGALRALKHWQQYGGKSVNRVIADEYGETAIKGIFPFLEYVASGKDKTSMEAMRREVPGDMTGKIDSSFQSLGSKYETFNQAVGALSSAFRRTFEPGAIEVLAGWQQAIEAVRLKMGEIKQESQISQNIKDFIGGTRGGFLDKVYGEGGANSSKTLDDAITSFAQSLTQGGWAETGKKLGAAVGDFVTVLGQIKDLVGGAHKYYKMLSPEEPSGPQKKPSGTPILGGLWDFDFNKSFPGWLLRGAPATEQLQASPLLSPGGTEPPQLLSAHRPGSNIMSPQASDGSAGQGQPQVTVNAQARNVFQVDGKVLVDEFTSMIVEKIDQAIESRKQGWANATHSPWQ